MKSIIKAIDFFSYQPTLYYNGQNRFQTVIGGILTIIFISIIISIGTIFLIQIFKNDIKTIIYSKEYVFDSTIKMNEMKFLFYLINSKEEVIPNNILQIVPTYKMDLNETKIETRKCISDEFYDMENIYVKNILQSSIDELFCFIEDLEIILGGDSLNHMNLYITKCNNDTSNVTCKTEEEINDYISNNLIFLNISYPSPNIYHDDRNNPFSYRQTIEKIEIYKDIYMIGDLKLRKIIYESNNGIFFDNIQKQERVAIEPFLIKNEGQMIFNDTLLDNSLSFFKISSYTGYAEKYYRTFNNFGTYIANFGGFINVLIYVFNVISYLFTKGLYFKDTISLTIFEESSNNSNNNINKNNIQGQQLRIKVKPNLNNQLIEDNNKFNMNKPSTILLKKSAGPSTFKEFNLKNSFDISNKDNSKYNFTVEPKKVHIFYSNIKLQGEKKKIEFKKISYIYTFLYTICLCQIHNKKYVLFQNYSDVIKYKLSSNIIIKTIDSITKIKNIYDIYKT